MIYKVGFHKNTIRYICVLRIYSFDYLLMSNI